NLCRKDFRKMATRKRSLLDQANHRIVFQAIQADALRARQGHRNCHERSGQSAGRSQRNYRTTRIISRPRATGESALKMINTRPGPSNPNFFPRPLGEGKAEGTRITLFLLIIAVSLLWTQSLTHAQELRRVLYGVSTSISHLPVWVGKDT